MLQGALNGRRTRDEHEAVPVTAEQVAEDLLASLLAGAREFHVHPRDEVGRETIDADLVNESIGRAAPGRDAPVGVTTAAWIESDPVRLAAHVRRWTAPRYTSVNLSEPGAFDVVRAALQAGLGVEAGVWTVADALALGRSGLADQLLRVLVEPVDPPPGDALAVVDEIHGALDRAGVGAPRLQHGEGASTWVLLEDAVRRGLDTRIGLEDTLLLPDGSRARDNADLIRAAVALGA